TRSWRNWRLLANGYLDELAYEIGAVDTGLPFAELRARSHVNERARSAGDAPDFSRRIREGLPGKATWSGRRGASTERCSQATARGLAAAAFPFGRGLRPRLRGGKRRGLPRPPETLSGNRAGAEQDEHPPVVHQADGHFAARLVDGDRPAVAQLGSLEQELVLGLVHELDGRSPLRPDHRLPGGVDPHERQRPYVVGCALPAAPARRAVDRLDRGADEELGAVEVAGLRRNRRQSDPEGARQTCEHTHGGLRLT